MKSIEKNKHYISTGNLFSKNLLVQEYVKKNNGPVLKIFTEESVLNHSIKIANFLQVALHKIQDFSDFIDFTLNENWIYATTQDVFFAHYPKNEYERKKHILELFSWKNYEIDDITKKLHDMWWKHSDHRTWSSFHVQWEVLSIVNNCESHTYKITFWWDEVEEIFIIDNLTNHSQKVDKIYLWDKNFTFFQEDTTVLNNDIFNLLKEKNTIFYELDFFQYSDEIYTHFQHWIFFHNFSQNTQTPEINLWISDLFLDTIDDFKKILSDNQYTQKYIYTKNVSSIKNFIEYNSLENIKIIETKLWNLKSFQTVDTITICDDNISRIFVKKRVKKSMSKKLDLLLQIKPWDYVVHVDHGIWIFKQTVEKQLQVWIQKTIKKEFIELEYAWNDKLFVPITEVGRINRYVWVENPKLTGLSTKQWEKTMKKVHENVEEVANELLEIYAQRALEKWYSFPKLPEQENKFFQSFEHNYTHDQYEIIQEIYADMESDKPMDRLVSWDVWFWKTEIAFASIYKAIIAWKQAALISPLVVLAYEHYEKALQRFWGFPFNIWIVTRFETKKNVEATLEKLKNGKIDLIVWTHRLLSEDIKFQDLWVLVIDEEHKFWVKDKDKIKKIRHNIDVLALSATPIPRSLNMALNGIKSMSMLTTPPVWRQAISTIVSKFDEKLILEAWKREFDRGWQLFFIHNKVTTIESLRDQLGIIFPKKKIIIAHWQLPGDQLEKRILSFKKKEYDILLATTVIENGIDFPNVNTIFINDAYNFWISQIHQLRWRVWRSDKQWFCYLLFNKDKIKEDAAKRLKTIVDYSHLWAWFELAVKDLEIRGGWDILWLKQSGQSTEVWMNLYLEMLEDKIEQLKKTGPENNNSENNGEGKRIHTAIEMQIWAYIDEQFFEWELDKINFYRELEALDTLEELNEIIQNFIQINQNIPLETNNFFDLLKLKLKAPEYKITHIKRVWINYQIDFDPSATIDDVKKFLRIDTEVKFWVTTPHRLRAPSKHFKDEQVFLKYMTDIFFNQSIKKTKIKLKKVTKNI